MQIVLLSGGCGKRLWPLSGENNSKQFLKYFLNRDGEYESMLQRMYHMICAADDGAEVTVATSRNQVDAIRAQIGGKVNISVEPCRRNTFPAIALACAYLHDCRGVSAEEVIVVCPVDSSVDAQYAGTLLRLAEEAKQDDANLVLMGIEPASPSPKFGYIIPQTADEISYVKHFKEKPDPATAAQYIAQGALWNGGVFAFKLGYLLSVAEKLLSCAEYRYLYDHYSDINSISFDRAVAEQERVIKVVRFSGAWNDLGTWDTLTDAMSSNTVGNSAVHECENTNIINELDIPVVALGVRNIAVVASPDGILVTDKESAEKITDYI